MSFVHKKHPSSKQSLYKSLAISFSVIVICIIGAIFYVSFSWATITLVPQITQTDYTFAVPIIQNLTDTSKEGGIRGSFFQGESDGKDSFPVQVTTTIPQKMKGVITLVNKSTKDQTLRATTRFTQGKGNEVLFRTKQLVVVPAGGRVDAEVEADKVGDIKIDQSAHFILPALWEGLQDKIYGVSFTPQTGLDTNGVGVLSEMDITDAREVLQKKLQEELQNKITTEKEQRGSSFDSVMTLEYSNEKANHTVGETVHDFSLSLHGLARVLFFDKTQMTSLLLAKVKEKNQLGYEVLPLHDTDIEYAFNTDSTGSNPTVRATVHVKRRLGVDALSINKKNFVGLRANEILDRLKKYPDVSDVSIRFYPFWVTKAPLLTDHIHILVTSSK